MDGRTVVSRTADLMSAPVDEDIVILNLARNAYVALDDIGRRIWDLLEEPLAVRELCRRLAEEYEGNPEQMERDLMAFLEDLEGEGMLNISPA